MTHSIDAWGRDYLLLALQVNRHFDGYVDAYAGPAELKAAAEAGDPRPFSSLRDDVQALAGSLSAQGYTEQREQFLRGQLLAVETTLRKLQGEVFDYREEVRRCFDVEIPAAGEADFEAAHRTLDTLLPGSGSLRERLQGYQDRFNVAHDVLPTLLHSVCDEVRRRTQAHVALPDGESVEIALVDDKPWSGYNWFLGAGRSLIEINTDLPNRAHQIVHLIAHEAYPGHHTEHALKESLLYHQRGHAESAVMLLNAPECVVSEGLANVGASLLFEPVEQIEWENRHLFAPAGIPVQDPQQIIALREASKALRFVAGRAATLLYEQGWKEEQVQEYLETYALRTPAEARQTLRFIQSPMFRAYIFTYTTGEELIRAAFAGKSTGERWDMFRRLLTEPVYPSQIANWAESTHEANSE